MDGANTSHAPAGTLSRDQILEVTSQCLAEQGYEAATIRQIAKRLDCAVGSIYRYFKDKHELMSAVAQQILEPVVELQDQGASLEDTVRCYVSAASTNAQTYRLMFWLAMIAQSKADLGDVSNDAASRPGDPEALSSPASMTHSRALPTVVERIIASWRSSLGSAAAAESCWATMHGWLTLQMPVEPIVSAVLREARTPHAKPQVGPALPSSAPAAAPQRNTATAQRPTARPVVEGDPDFIVGGSRPAGRLDLPRHEAQESRLPSRAVEPADSDELPVTISRPTSPAQIERSFSLIRASLGDAAAKAEALASEPDAAMVQSRTAADLVVGYSGQASDDEETSDNADNTPVGHRDQEDVTLL